MMASPMSFPRIAPPALAFPMVSFLSIALQPNSSARIGSSSVDIRTVASHTLGPRTLSLPVDSQWSPGCRFGNAPAMSSVYDHKDPCQS